MQKHSVTGTWFFIAMAVVLMTSATVCKAAEEKSEKDSLQAREKLGAMGIQYTEDAFAKAARSGDKLAVELFLDAGMDVNAKHALVYASMDGRTEIVKLLLDKGADAKAKHHGRTAMKVAWKNGHTEVVQLLKNAGAKEWE